MEPEDLAVIGHTGDLLVDIYARNLTHIYILPQCSTTAARVLNPAEMDAQFERLRCAISRGILNYGFSTYFAFSLFIVILAHHLHPPLKLCKHLCFRLRVLCFLMQVRVLLKRYTNNLCFLWYSDSYRASAL